ncbi:unnamed protein product [Parnassius mnemosyne]|uniref:Endonuclease/exonuclease/phosphatase domain-containing protein n=1 Tax=Parnassius mnemosyne TaxID=213953 RepID=A0AAV1MC06_9NEOP
MADALDKLELHILNKGSGPTFDTIRGGRRFSSCVDITTYSTDLLGKIGNWRLSGDVIGSDHRAILFELELGKAVGIDIKRTTRKFNTRKANWSEFHTKLAQLWQNKSLNVTSIKEIDSKIVL